MNLKERQAIRARVEKATTYWEIEVLLATDIPDLLNAFEKALELLEEADKFTGEGQTVFYPLKAFGKKVEAFLDKHRSKP